jgi:hypothetical protein
MKINNLKMISSFIDGSYHSIIFQSINKKLKYKNKKYVNRSIFAGSSYLYWKKNNEINPGIILRKNNIWMFLLKTGIKKRNI